MPLPPKAPLLLLLTLAIPVGAEEQRPDAFLRAWVEGKAAYDLFGDFHRIASTSPHKGDSERFEVAVKAFHLRNACGEDRAVSLAAELLAVLDGQGSPEEVRVRAIHVLGRLREPAAVDRIAQVALADHGSEQDAAIAALSFFGSAPAEEAFLVFGGRWRRVVFPPAAAPTATATLLAILQRPPAAGVGAPERRRRGEVHVAALRALSSHRGPPVAAAVLHEVLRPRRAASLELLERLLLPHAATMDVRGLAKVVAAADPGVRVLGVRALGWSGRQEALPILEGLGEDPRDDIRLAWLAALHRLAGEPPPDPPESTRWTREEWETHLRSVDPLRALRYPDPVPGIYVTGG